MVLLTSPGLQKSECEFVEVILNNNSGYSNECDEDTDYNDNNGNNYEINTNKLPSIAPLKSKDSPWDAKSLHLDTIITNDVSTSNIDNSISNKHNDDTMNKN